MARTKKVKVEEFGAAVLELLEDYADDVSGKMPMAVETVAQHTGQKVREAITASGIKGTKYKNSIAVKVTKGRLLASATIYSPKHYRLTHLLEHGHVLKAHGKTYGTTRAFPHWAPAEQAAIKELESTIKKAVRT